MKIIKPKRASHTYVQRLVGQPDMVFALLCPVREADWIEGWNPLLVVSDSGLAERDCVFVTSSLPSNAVWYITGHEPDARLIEMIKLTAGVTACRLTIQVRASNEGSLAEITYTHTSLGPEGDAFVEAFTEAHYAAFMKDWEAQMNRYLRRAAAKA